MARLGTVADGDCDCGGTVSDGRGVNRPVDGVVGAVTTGVVDAPASETPERPATSTSVTTKKIAALSPATVRRARVAARERGRGRGAGADTRFGTSPRTGSGWY